MTTHRPFWRSYARASVLLSLFLGFGLGGTLFFLLAGGQHASLAWIAGAQTHGHVQHFGWAGLMVLGVALHFVPRLAGGREVDPRFAYAALIFLVSGLFLRSATSVALAETIDPNRAKILRWSLVVAVACELLGALIAVGALFAALRPTLENRRQAFLSIVPLGLLAVASLVGALAVDAYGAIELARSDDRLVSARVVEVTLLLAQSGFLLAISIAMSARIMPLYIRTPLAGRRGLFAVAAVLAAGVTAGGAGIWRDNGNLESAGRILTAMGVFLAIWVLGLLKRRRLLPRQPVRVWDEPMQWYFALAYFWLVLASGLSLLTALSDIEVIGSSPSLSLQRHAFGSGFVTLLILGVGQTLLPGFAKRTIRAISLMWIILVISNISTIFRVLAAVDSGRWKGAEALGGLAGVLASVTIMLFAWNSGVFGSNQRSVHQLR